MAANAVSIIIPSYKRVEQTIKTLKLIFFCKGFGSDFEAEVIVSDCTPDRSLQEAINKEFGDKIIYTRPEKEGIAASKNQGAKMANKPILIFCDSDIEIELETVANTIKSLETNKTAGAVTGEVIWRGGPANGRLDRPRQEDRLERVYDTTYIESIYSRYMATYKSVFEAVGGYDQEVFNMRGEGSDLSIRYWRAGFPLTIDPDIVVYHVFDAPDSAALRVAAPFWGVAKDMLLLAYKYDLTDSFPENFARTVEANFALLGPEGYFRILEGIVKNLDFIEKVKPIIDKQKKEMKPVYNFKFLEVFSDRALFENCIAQAPERIRKVNKF